MEKKKRLLTGGLIVMALLAIVMLGMKVLPKANAGQSMLDSARTIRPGVTTVSPGGYYKITGDNTSTYTLTYSGSASDEPAYLVLEDAHFQMSADAPAIVLNSQEAADSESSSYEGNFVVYIKGQNTIKSTAQGAKSALIQIENMSYEIKKYDRNSPYTDDIKKFKTEMVNRICNVTFRNAGNADDSLTVETASGSYGAGIGSSELAEMGKNIKFKSGQSAWYIVIDGVRYAHGQEIFTGQLRCGSGNLTIQDATILVKGNGYGAGIGCGASVDSRITFRTDNKVGSVNTQTANAKDVMNGNNIIVKNGALAVRMSASSYGDCVGTGSIGGAAYSQGVVTITGGSMDLSAEGHGARYLRAVNAGGVEVYPFLLNVQRAIGDAYFTDGMTYDLEDTVGGSSEYTAQYSGEDAEADGDLSLIVTQENGTAYSFHGYANAYYSFLGTKTLAFWLPTQILDSYEMMVNGNLDSVQYEYKVGNGAYQTIDAGYAIHAKETKKITLRLKQVPRFCTSVVYATSNGDTGTLTPDENGEYLYSFHMPSANFSVAFQYEIGKYSIVYDLGTEDTAVHNPNVKTYACGETYNLQEPSWEGRTFAGWYADAEYTTPVAAVMTEVPDEVIRVYAKWICQVTFKDDADNVLYQKEYAYGYRFTERDYPTDPIDTEDKAFLGWKIDGTEYEKGEYKEFLLTEHTVITGFYKEIGYYVHINGTFTNKDEVTTIADLAKMGDFQFYFKGQPIAFTTEATQPDLYYSTVSYANRSDMTTGKITAKNGYQLETIVAKDAQGNVLDLFHSMDDEHAFTFQMPNYDVYLTVNFRTPDYTIAYYDYNEKDKVFETVIPVEEDGNKTQYAFNAHSPEIALNPAPNQDKYQRFAGWYVFGDETKKAIHSIPTGAYSKDLVLIAIWEEVDTCEIRVSEESKQYVKIYDADGTEVDKGIPGELISIVVLPKRGVRYESVTYTYTDDDMGVYTNRKVPNEDTVYPVVYRFVMPKYPVDVFGEFSLIEYQITYLSLFGAENPNPQTYNIESRITLQDPVRPGFAFKGWSIVLPDGENGYDSTKEEAIEVIQNREGNLILVAKWEVEETPAPPEKYRIRISDLIQNGAVTAYSTEAEAGQYVFLKIEPKNGYRLRGVSYSRAEETETYSLTRSLRAVEDLLGVKFEVPLFDVAENVYYFVMPEMDIEVYAEFEMVEYEITYLDGEAGENPGTYNIASEIILKDAKKDGYIFLGWYDENGNKVTEINHATGNLTLLAKWKEEKKEPEQDVTPQPEPPQPKPSQSESPTVNPPAKTDEFISQITQWIQNNSKLNSSEDTAGAEHTNKVVPSQIKTGDTARVSHLVLTCILSLLILILAYPKKKDEEEY